MNSKIQRIREAGITFAVGVVNTIWLDYFAIITWKDYKAYRYELSIWGTSSGNGYYFIDLKSREDIAYVRAMIQNRELIFASRCEWGYVFHNPDCPLKAESVEKNDRIYSDWQRELARIKRQKRKRNNGWI